MNEQVAQEQSGNEGPEDRFEYTCFRQETDTCAACGIDLYDYEGAVCGDCRTVLLAEGR